MSTAAAVQAREALPVGTWNVDPVHSHVGFAVQYVAGTFRGSFSPLGAQLQVDEAGQARLSGSVPVSGVKVQDENLTAHLQTPDFFDAERAPEITFSAREIRRSGDQVQIDGELTIRGTTRPVELRGTVTEPQEDPFGNTKFGLALQTTVDRTDFGLNWNNPLPSGQPSLANEVALTAELQLVKA